MKHSKKMSQAKKTSGAKDQAAAIAVQPVEPAAKEPVPEQEAPDSASTGAASAPPKVAPDNTAGVPRTKPRSRKSKAALISEIRADGVRVLNQMRELAQLQTKGCTTALRWIGAASDHLDPTQAQLVANDVCEAIGALVAVAVALNAYVANAPRSSRSTAKVGHVNGAARRGPASPAESSPTARAREKLRQARSNSTAIPTPNA